MAFRGKATTAGDFEVSGICYPGLPDPCTTLAPPSAIPDTGNPMVLFVSGLQFGDTRQPSAELGHMMLRDFVLSSAASAREGRLLSRVVRMIVAGSSAYVPNSLIGTEVRSTTQTAHQSTSHTLSNLSALPAPVAATSH